MQKFTIIRNSCLLWLLIFSACCLGCGKPGKVLIIIANSNFDDLEYTIVYARLKAAGFILQTAAPETSTAYGLGGLEVQPDLKIADAEAKDYHSLCLIGGSGARALYDDNRLQELCRFFYKAGKTIAAQELSSLVPAKAGLLKGKKASAWPSAATELKACGALYSKAVVTRSGIVLTGMGGSDENITRFTAHYIGMLLGWRTLYAAPDREIVWQPDSTQTRYVMTHKEKTRTGLIYIPPAYNGSKACSLVFGLHGTGGSGRDFLRMGFNPLADELDFIMVYPDGYNGDWDILPDRETRFDDAGYFRALIAVLKKHYNIDPARIYVTGFSLGAYMAYRIAYDLSDVITAAAPASGLVYLPPSVKPLAKPVSLLHLHTVKDWNVPFEGDKLYASPASVMRGLDFWKTNNAITASGRLFFDRDGIKGTVWSNPANRADIALLVYPGDAHAWQPYATEQIADFFYNHPARSNSIKMDYRTLTPYNTTGSPVRIQVNVRETETVKRVVFYSNSREIGAVTEPPYAISWNSDAPGQYRLTASAELNSGEKIHSTVNERIWITRKDLAKGREATASSVESGQLLPEQATDCNPLTRWASVAADPQWITVNLKKKQMVAGVTLIWEDAFASAYDIQASPDGRNWKTVYSAATDKGGTAMLAFEPVYAQYIRMYGKSRATVWGYSLWEFMVHGE